MSSRHTAPDISLQLCEKIGEQESRPYIFREKSFHLVTIEDPFGIRRAIFPILEVCSDNSLVGLGSAFSLDPWNRILTAQHVVESHRLSDRRGIVALLSYGLVFGTVSIPEDAFAQIEKTYAFSVADQNPLNQLSGSARDVHFDLAWGYLTNRHDPRRISNLPIRAHTYGCIRPGDHVVALGFPNIKLLRDDPENIFTTISEGASARLGEL